MSKIRVQAAIVTTNGGVTLYLENGEERNIPGDRWSAKQIMDEIVAPLSRKEIVEVDLDTYEITSQIEKRSGGLIRFVKEKFSKVKGWFAHEGGVAAEPIGTKSGEVAVTVPPTSDVVLSVEVESPDPSPDVDARDRYEPKPKEGDERTVAIVGDKRIPHVEKLERHMEAAVLTKSKGFENFMKRLAAVIDKREHSVKELLHFMEKADLPIADDGTIVAYKVLKTYNGNIVDCHSSKVVQRVGSRVCMDESLVDRSRRTECSVGLHIARRGYLSHFSGDKIMLVKVAPEDVIAVPYGEPDKMRAAAYHIVGELPEHVHGVLRSNRPMTGDSEAAMLLAKIIAGDHADVIEEVRIGAGYGGKLTITPVVGGKLEPKVEAPVALARALDDGINVIDIKEIRKTSQAIISEEMKKAATTGDMSAAVSVTETRQSVSKPEPTKSAPKAEKRASKPEKPKAAASKAKTAKVAELKPGTKLKATSAPKTTGAKKLTERQEFLLGLMKAGGSQREIARDHKVCAKSLRKLWKEHGPNEAHAPKDAAE